MPSAREASEFDSNITSLSLPRVGEDRRARNGTKEQWEFQTYEEFARQAEHKDPDMAFHKETVDAAFRLVISRSTPHIRLLHKSAVNTVTARVSEDLCRILVAGTND